MITDQHILRSYGRYWVHQAKGRFMGNAMQWNVDKIISVDVA